MSSKNTTKITQKLYKNRKRNKKLKNNLGIYKAMYTIYELKMTLNSF